MTDANETKAWADNLDTLDALAQAATPGPWVVTCLRTREGAYDNVEADSGAAVALCYCDADGCSGANAAFIAAARAEAKAFDEAAPKG